MSLSKAIGLVSGINEVLNCVQSVKQAVSYVRSRLGGTQEEQIQEEQIQEHELLQLQTDLRDLSETLPAMYNRIDRAEWRSHVHCVAELLPKLKDAVYDAEDLLDEFKWYELKASVEGNAAPVPPFIDFFRSVTQSSFNKVTAIQRRLNNISCELDKMDLPEATPRFDKSVRPVTTSFPTEPKIFGRDKEIKELLRRLGVPNSSKRQRSCDESTPLSVLPIVGMGGIGKTTIVQEITTRLRVESHFDNKIIWICVSDDFNAKRITKDIIKSLSGKEVTTDNFDNLQKVLQAEVRKKSFLLILDDIWPDVVKHWSQFFAPLRNAHRRSRLLVTTRFTEVAKTVSPMGEPFALEGLKPTAFWNFFKLCVFGFENYPIDTQLKRIGEDICNNLKGSPLAAKTIGRLLRRSIETEHWNDILKSELWQLKQKETDILPALRLSYMYLPFHLKRCFSFCAVCPKDYSFKKASLAEIWVAQGFVEPQGQRQLQHIGEEYFEELVNLSFFHKHRGSYVIHDLIHDMAQLVSKDECFIAKTGCDYEKVPQNVRHLMILPSSDVQLSHLSSLCKRTKLRTLLCYKSLGNFDSVVSHWFEELQCLRVISLASISFLPWSIGNLKHLRYLEVSKACPFISLPSSFCCLYNLQILYARKCNVESLPSGLSKLMNLQKFETKIPVLKIRVDAVGWGKKSWFVNYIKSSRSLELYNLDAISKDHAEGIKLREMEHLTGITLEWSSLMSQEDNEIEVLQGLHPPTTIKDVHIRGYPDEYLPSWFHQCIFSSLIELSIVGCQNLLSLEKFLRPAYVPPISNSIGTFSSLRFLEIHKCKKLQNLGGLLSHEYLPAVMEIHITACKELQFLPGERFESFQFLTSLKIGKCPLLNWQSGMVLPSSLQRLTLCKCGDLSSCFPRCLENLTSLLSLELACCKHIVSVPGNLWSSVLVSLRQLEILNCPDLVSIGGPNTISNIENVHISGCENLKEVEQPLRK